MIVSKIVVYLCNQNLLIMALNIKKAIKSHGLEVREVAARMNITPTGLSQHINGNPSVEVLNRIAEAIGCDVVELFDTPRGNEFFCPNCGAVYEIIRKK